MTWGYWGLGRFAADTPDWELRDAYDDDHSWDDGEPIPATGKWYHASPYDLPDGTVLQPGHSPSRHQEWYDTEEGQSPEKRRRWVWMEPDLEGAEQWVPHDSINGLGHVYEVRPSHDPLPWNGTGQHGHVADSATIVRKVPPEEVEGGWSSHTAAVEADVAEDLRRLAMPQIKDIIPADNSFLDPDPDGEPSHYRPPRDGDITATPPSGKWYHVSETALAPGTKIVPRGGPSPDPEFYSDGTDEDSDGYDNSNRRNHVWLAPNLGTALFWSWSMVAPHIHEVKPGGKPQPWNFDGTNGWVAPHAHVIRHVSGDGAHGLGIKFDEWENHITARRTAAPGLGQSIAEFGRSANACPPGQPYGDCESTATDFVRFLQERGHHDVNPRVHQYADPRMDAFPSPARPDLEESTKTPGHWGRGGHYPVGHFVAVIDHHGEPHAVDWAMRQFDPHAEFPHIEPLNSYEKKFRLDLMSRHARRTAAPRRKDPQQVVQRLRDLNHRHYLHRSRRPVPDRVLAEHPPLSLREEAERQQLSSLSDRLQSQWHAMEPMTDTEDALHRAFHPADRRHDNLEAMTDRQKARHFSDLSNPLFMSGGRTPREQHQYDRLADWAEGHFGNMQNDAHDALARWDDYHRTGYHPTGITSLADLENAHHPDLTSAWGAEMTRITSDRTPVRDALPTYHYMEVAEAARAHRKALEEMAEHGPLHYNTDRNSNLYTHEHVEDTRNRLRAELQHNKVFTVPDVSELSRVAHPGEAHAQGMLVNPRYFHGMGSPAGYQSYAERRAYQINCQRCVLASEARHRGYNVEAARNYRPVEDDISHPDNDLQFGDHDIASWFVDADGKVPRWNDVEDEDPQHTSGLGHWDHMHEQIKAWGPGARGIVAVTYKSSGGGTKRHVLSAHVRADGTVNYHDPQTAEDNQDQHWRNKVDYAGSKTEHQESRGLAAQNWDTKFATNLHNKYYSPLRYLRTDDKELHPSAAQHMVDRGTAPDEPMHARDPFPPLN